MQHLSKHDQLVLDVAFAARHRFPKTPMRIWYVMLNEKAWKGIVINTASKMKLAEGPIRATPNGSLSALKAQIEKATHKADKEIKTTPSGS